MNKKIIVSLVIVTVCIAGATFYILSRKDSTPIQLQNEQKAQTTESPKQDSADKKDFDKAKYSIDAPGSLWWIVNKTRPLPDGYVPADLITPAVKLRLAAGAEQMQYSKQAEPALIEMFNAAKQDGIILVFGSGYRSYALQKQFYDSYVAKDGQAAADRYSAKPGTSEHQTGLSFDATSVSEKCHLEICFADTPEGQWIKSNAHKYGFIVRYPNGKESITGYQYEPWHLRYVGTDLATELQKTGQTMEEFFNLN